MYPLNLDSLATAPTCRKQKRRDILRVRRIVTGDRRKALCRKLRHGGGGSVVDSTSPQRSGLQGGIFEFAAIAAVAILVLHDMRKHWPVARG